ncbi:hypothetical protein [Propionibacterium sp. oral taxon 192]|uniref:hypothetical protein n=1 Tax=Propionibacterium sp. oral taxon 192 TaxID=671222 RepID=UPI0018DC8F31
MNSLDDVRGAGDAIPANLIERASAPGLYCALTRRSDYCDVEGLPADPKRTLAVNGTRLRAQD